MREVCGNCKHNKRDFSKPQNSGYAEFCCGNEDICLYGFPFSLLENCEIVRLNEDLSEVNVIDYMNIFKKYAKVNKRFGF